MATADQILALATSAMENDNNRLIAVCRQIIAHEKPNSRLRRRLEDLLHRKKGVLQTLHPDLQGLVTGQPPTLSLEDVILPEAIEREVGQFLRERAHRNRLQAAGIPAPHRILLAGPPGNGKTVLAGAIAERLDVPFLALDYTRILQSYLGATGASLGKVFRGIGEMPAVLFIDEMETVLTERNAQGRGADSMEMARVVSTLLLEIDRLPESVILIGATNHPEMLDRAVVRRFEYHWELPVPDAGMIARWFDRFARRHPAVPLQVHRSEVLADAEGQSFSDIERAAYAWCRAWVTREEAA